jgi:hypothetical protein
MRLTFELARDLPPIALDGVMTHPTRYRVQGDLRADQVLELVDDIGEVIESWTVNAEAPFRRIDDELVHRLPNLVLRFAS